MTLDWLTAVLERAGVPLTPEQVRVVAEANDEDDTWEIEAECRAAAREEWLAHGDADDDYVSGRMVTYNDAGEPWGYM